MVEFVLGIDGGTECVKSGIYNLKGNTIGIGSSYYKTYHLHPGWADQKIEEWDECLIKSIKEAIKVYLSKKKLTFQDLGPHNNDRVDYPDYAHKVAKRVKISKNNIGILVCGSGMGMNIAANRHKNIRAAQCFNLKSFCKSFIC